MVVQCYREGRMGSYCLVGTECVLKDEKSYGMDVRWLHNNVDVFLSLN